MMTLSVATSLPGKQEGNSRRPLIGVPRSGHRNKIPAAQIAAGKTAAPQLLPVQQFSYDMAVDILHPSGDAVIRRASVTGLPGGDDRLHTREIPGDMVIITVNNVSSPDVPLYWPDNNDNPPMTMLIPLIRTVWWKDRLVQITA